MKWTAHVAYVVGGLWVKSVFAIIPFTLSGPTPALATSYSVGTTNTYIYTLTNNVPGLAVPITVSGLSSPISRTATSNDCGNTTPVGPSTCNIGVTIAPTSGNAGQNYQQTLAVDYHGRTPLTSILQFTVPASESSFFITAGRGGANPPTLAQSIDAGATWSTLLDIPSFPSEGLLFTSSCTGGTLCIAGGRSGGGTSPSPFIVQSEDQGANWTIPNLVGAESIGGTIRGSSCTGSDATAICVGVGQDQSTGTPALLVQTTNGGTTWSRVAVSGIPSSATLTTASCTGSSTTAICVAGGSTPANAANTAPLLIQTMNGGTSWGVISTSLTQGRISSINCAGSDSTATCVAAGVDNTGGPYLFQTTNGGTTWSAPNLSGIAFGDLNGVSCVGSGSNTACSAVGSNFTTSQGKILHTSNNGASWTDVTPTLPTSSNFNTIACIGDSSNGFCVAAGRGAGTSAPLLVQSNDGGESWTSVTVTGLAVGGNFSGSSCTMNNGVPVCTVSGSNGASPLLIQTLDGGSNWSVVSVVDAPTIGVFTSTGTTM